MVKHKKLRALAELVRLLSRYRKVALTTGAFDVPHIGHIRYLRKAKSKGRVLVLILHSDALIASRKGQDRPIRKEATRVRRIARGKAYSCVDYIFVAQTQEDVYAAISAIQPHTLVTSETTEDPENCPATMKRLFSTIMKVEVLGPQAVVHSTDIIKKHRLVKAPAS